MLNKLMESRLKRFKDTARLQNKDRVINCSNLWAWMVYDSEFSLNEAARDYDKRLKLVTDNYERYQFDIYSDFWTRNPARVTDALGGGNFILVDKPFNVIIDDYNYWEGVEDYKALLDYNNFLWTKLIPRKLKSLLGDDVIERLKKADKELVTYRQYNKKISDLMRDKYSTMCLFAGDTVFTAPYLECLYIDLMGLKGVSMEMRRHPEEMKELLDAFGAYNFNILSREKGSDPNKPADATFCGIAQTFLSPKQFEKFYLPYMKQIFDYAGEYEKVIYCFWEGENARFYDYILDMPKGTSINYFEKDDLFEAKKKFGSKAAIAGGMPADMLYKSTSKECVDYAKKLIDELAYDGGYMFGADKMITYPHDCKRENLQAVCDFVNNYNV